MRLSLPKGAMRGLAALCLALGAILVAPELAVAQSSTEAQLAVRVQDLEASVRDLTGQVEQLQHALQLLQQQIEKMQQDDDFRFQQLEGAGTKKPASGGAQSSGTLTTTPPAGQKSSVAASSAAPPPLVAGKTAAAQDKSVQPSDGLGDSQDPLVGKGGTQSAATLGTLPAGQDGSAPLDLNLDSSQPISSGDADAQYKAGYDAIIRKDYAFAEDQFRQFIALYPKDPQAPDATNWLGESLLEQANAQTGDDQVSTYTDAADVLFKGYKAYQTSPRAPDLLLKLAIALAGAGQQDTACRTFFQIAQLYPKQPAAFMQRLKDEKAKAQCKV